VALGRQLNSGFCALACGERDREIHAASRMPILLQICSFSMGMQNISGKLLKPANAEFKYILRQTDYRREHLFFCTFGLMESGWVKTG